ncbi:MAG: HAD family phosphatase [Acidobacteriaceae bacterium]|nr:HAD family phosphatase [Acidobacteriaceae bacterium]
MALVNSFDSFIFDYGGVLVRHQTDADHARMAAILGIAPIRFSELYWAKRVDYDKDSTNAADYWQDIASETGVTLTTGVIDSLTSLDTESWMQFDEVMWDWIGQLRKVRKRVAMLSNMPRELGEALRTRTTRLELFDQITLSYEVRAAKPEPVIYEHCLEGLDALPERTLFFDDRIENIQSAELLGIRAIQFLDRDQVLLQVRD